MSFTRRGFTRLAASLGLSLTSLPAVARQTPGATEGPFYPTQKMRFTDADNDLVRISGLDRVALGDVMILKGRILDRDGNPAEGARIEIWQCDANGVYLHTRDRNRGYDEAFQGFGHVVTGEDGAYAFRTIKPVTYPGRTPHIHVKVFHSGREFTSQFYIADHPQNARDGIFQRLSKEQQAMVSMRFQTGPDGPEAEITVNL